MKSDQLPLELPPQVAMGRADFLESPSNAAALAAVLTPQRWPMPRLVIAGPNGSGRTHLSHIFAEITRGRVIQAAAITEAGPGCGPLAVDDAHLIAGKPAAEEALFHIYNSAQADAAPLLILGRDLPGTWGIALPDLTSRLAACPLTELNAPDDNLLKMVLAKLFSERQLFPDTDVMTFLVARMNRSLDEARDLVAAIDSAALAEQRRVTKRLAGEVLKEYSAVSR
ncbi:MAG: DnaA/Hda family protein [Pseudomonadota bacterium]